VRGVSSRYEHADHTLACNSERGGRWGGWKTRRHSVLDPVARTGQVGGARGSEGGGGVWDEEEAMGHQGILVRGGEGGGRER
jgi:hypothetical protein